MLLRTCSLEKNFIHSRENETVIEQLLIIMDWVPALVWHTSDPYQDSGKPSTRVSRPGGVVREQY
jgi:hypothetical protein